MSVRTATKSDARYSSELLEVVRWTGRLGAVTAEAMAHHQQRPLASARALLLSGERAGLVRRSRVLANAPTLYAVTGAGLRAAGLRGLEPSRVSVANAPHAIASAAAAAALERAYPDHEVMGERELRREERETGHALASAPIRVGGDGALHRPDLVLWPTGSGGALPVAVEVELTAKSPRRLLEICRAWARCRCVAGALYLTAAEVRRPLARAIDAAQAHERVVAVALDALLAGETSSQPAPACTVPSET
ncbi:MAG: hypothetical protein ACRDJX_07090 [Solirubrobacteraceae bacterium]